MTTKYRPSPADVDREPDGSYILNLPKGFRFSNEVVHTRGFDTMKELRDAVKNDVIPCNCNSCKEPIR